MPSSRNLLYLFLTTPSIQRPFTLSYQCLHVSGNGFGDAGSENIMIESNIVAQGSINGVISGHHYNRSIRAHKCIMETVERLRWQAYITSLSDVNYASTYEILAKLQSDFPTSAFRVCGRRRISGYGIFLSFFCGTTFHIEFVQGEEFQAMASS